MAAPPLQGVAPRSGRRDSRRHARLLGHIAADASHPGGLLLGALQRDEQADVLEKTKAQRALERAAKPQHGQRAFDLLAIMVTAERAPPAGCCAPCGSGLAEPAKPLPRCDRADTPTRTPMPDMVATKVRVLALCARFGRVCCCGATTSRDG